MKRAGRQTMQQTCYLNAVLEQEILSQSLIDMKPICVPKLVPSRK